MYGPIKYRMCFLDRDKLGENNMLHDHDEVLLHLKRYARQNKNIALRTNYPWVLGKKSEIHGDIEKYKLMIIPRPMLIKNILHKFRSLILYDKYAYINELLRIVSVDASAQLLGIPLASNTQAFTVHELVHYCIKHNDSQCISRITDVVTCMINELIQSSGYTNDCANRQQQLDKRRGKKTTTDDFMIRTKHPIIARLPYCCVDTTISIWVNGKINANVHMLKKILKYKIRGNLEFQSLMQGKKSLVREAVCTKCPALRSQIVSLPSLRPNQLVVPISKAHMFNVTCVELMPLDNDDVPIPEAKYFQKIDARVLFKRDPAINGGSVSGHDEIAFSRSDFFYTGNGDLEPKNADFDGDTETAFGESNPVSVDEIDLNLLSKNNLRIYQQVRISFSESHIIYMHRRRFASNAFKFAAYYNMIRDLEIKKWMTDRRNIVMLNKLQDEYPDYDFERYIEPTRNILKATLNGIIQIYSDRDGYEFYNFINEHVLRLASGRTDTPLYDPALRQFDYVMGDNLLCDTMLRSTFSEAKGSLEYLYSMLKKNKQCDNTTRIIAEYKAKVTRSELFNHMDTTVVSMAKKSRDVPLNGHTFFRTSIGYDTIGFNDDALTYNNTRIYPHLNLVPNSLLIPPEIAGYITNGIEWRNDEHLRADESLSL